MLNRVILAWRRYQRNLQCRTMSFDEVSPIDGVQNDILTSDKFIGQIFDELTAVSGDNILIVYFLAYSSVEPVYCRQPLGLKEWSLQACDVLLQVAFNTGLT